LYAVVSWETSDRPRDETAERFWHRRITTEKEVAVLTRSARVWVLAVLVLGLGVVPGRAEWRRSFNTSCDCNGGSSYTPPAYVMPTPVYTPPPPVSYSAPQPTFQPPAPPAPVYTPPQPSANYTPPAAMPSAPTTIASSTPTNVSNYTPQPQPAPPPPGPEMALAQPDGAVPIYNPPTPVQPGPPLTMPAPTQSTVYASPGCCDSSCCDGGCCFVVDATCHPGLIARIKAKCAEKKAAKACCSPCDSCCTPCDPCCCTAKCHPIIDKIKAHHEAKKCAEPCGEKKYLFKCFHKKKDGCPVETVGYIGE
jgi:hypothetical protein